MTKHPIQLILTDIEIRTAILKDIDQLLMLNLKWQKPILIDLQNGYLGAKFSKSTFVRLIKKKQVVVAYYKYELCGYYLLNNISKDGVIGRHENMVVALKTIGKIDEGVSVCVGGQVIVDTGFMGSGVRLLMLNKLTKNVLGKYDFLFGTIAKDNQRAFKAHTRDGWQVVGEDENLYYVIFNVKCPVPLGA